ncbi:MAG: hypothetical protein IJX14_00750 [Clostridia bacterium]|nr:hypothetical protein [Clostridia bacterium]
MDTEKQRELMQQILEAGFAGGAGLTELREQLGIDGDTWEAWLRGGSVPGDLVSLSRAMAEMCAPWVWASLLELTRDGSIPAMKLYFALCREQNPTPAAGFCDNREIMTLRQEIFGRQESGAGG